MKNELFSLQPYVRQIKTLVSPMQAIGYIVPDYVLTLIKRGKATFVLNGVNYEIVAGDLLFFPAYIHHLIKPVEELEHLIIHFDSVYDEAYLGQEIYQNPPFDSYNEFLQSCSPLDKALCEMPFQAHLPETVFYKLSQRFMEGLAWHERGEAYTSLFLNALTNEMLFLLNLYGNADQSIVGSKTKQWPMIEVVIAYMHKHYNQKISLAAAAEMACMSRTYFCRMFKEYIGENFHHYQMRLRIEEAKKILADPEINFTEVAECTGFSNIYHFSRVFKEMEGCTLTDYRKQSKEGF